MSDGPSVIPPSRILQPFTANLGSFKVVRTFGPNDAVADPLRVRPLEEGWRVEVTTKGRGLEVSPSVAVFRMLHPGIACVQLAIRCRASVESVPRMVTFSLRDEAPTGLFGSWGFEPPETGSTFINLSENFRPGSLFEFWGWTTLSLKSKKAPKEIEIRIVTVPDGVVNVREMTVFDATGVNLNPL